MWSKSFCVLLLAPYNVIANFQDDVARRLEGYTPSKPSVIHTVGRRAQQWSNVTSSIPQTTKITAAVAPTLLETTDIPSTTARHEVWSICQSSSRDQENLTAISTKPGTAISSDTDMTMSTSSLIATTKVLTTSLSSEWSYQSRNVMSSASSTSRYTTPTAKSNSSNSDHNPSIDVTTWSSEFSSGPTGSTCSDQVPTAPISVSTMMYASTDEPQSVPLSTVASITSISVFAVPPSLVMTSEASITTLSRTIVPVPTSYSLVASIPESTASVGASNTSSNATPITTNDPLSQGPPSVSQPPELTESATITSSESISAPSFSETTTDLSSTTEGVVASISGTSVASSHSSQAGTGGTPAPSLSTSSPTFFSSDSSSVASDTLAPSRGEHPSNVTSSSDPSSNITRATQKSGTDTDFSSSSTIGGLDSSSSFLSSSLTSTKSILPAATQAIDSSTFAPATVPSTEYSVTASEALSTTDIASNITSLVSTASSSSTARSSSFTQTSTAIAALADNAPSPLTKTQTAGIAVAGTTCLLIALIAGVFLLRRCHSKANAKRNSGGSMYPEGASFYDPAIPLNTDDDNAGGRDAMNEMSGGAWGYQSPLRKSSSCSGQDNNDSSGPDPFRGGVIPSPQSTPRFDEQRRPWDTLHSESAEMELASAASPDPPTQRYPELSPYDYRNSIPGSVRERSSSVYDNPFSDPFPHDLLLEVDTRTETNDSIIIVGPPPTPRPNRGHFKSTAPYIPESTRMANNRISHISSRGPQRTSTMNDSPVSPIVPPAAPFADTSFRSPNFVFPPPPSSSMSRYTPDSFRASRHHGLTPIDISPVSPVSPILPPPPVATQLPKHVGWADIKLSTPTSSLSSVSIPAPLNLPSPHSRRPGRTSHHQRSQPPLAGAGTLRSMQVSPLKFPMKVGGAPRNHYGAKRHTHEASVEVPLLNVMKERANEIRVHSKRSSELLFARPDLIGREF